MGMVTMSFDKTYHDILSSFIPRNRNETIHEICHNFSQSQGAETHQARLGFDINIDLEKDPVPLQSLVYMNPCIAAAETGWIFDGSPDLPGFFPNGVKEMFSKMSLFGTNPDAYGYRLRKTHGIDQIRVVIEILKHDHSSRKAIMILWNPKTDLTGDHNKPHRRYAPCPTQLGFHITKTGEGSFLDSWMVLRSSDVIFGLPYDVLRHALMTHAIFNSLKVEYPSLRTGKMRLNLHNCHIYDSHYQWFANTDNAEKFELSHRASLKDHMVYFPEAFPPDTGIYNALRWTSEAIELNPGPYSALFNNMAQHYRNTIPIIKSGTFEVVE